MRSMLLRFPRRAPVGRNAVADFAGGRRIVTRPPGPVALDAVWIAAVVAFLIVSLGLARAVRHLQSGD